MGLPRTKNSAVYKMHAFFFPWDFVCPIFFFLYSWYCSTLKQACFFEIVQFKPLVQRSYSFILNLLLNFRKIQEQGISFCNHLVWFYFSSFKTSFCFYVSKYLSAFILKQYKSSHYRGSIQWVCVVHYYCINTLEQHPT